MDNGDGATPTVICTECSKSSFFDGIAERLDEKPSKRATTKVVRARFIYTNHNGITSERTVDDPRLRFGDTVYYPEKQLLLDGWDVDKKAERTFAVARIKKYLGAEEVPRSLDG